MPAFLYFGFPLLALLNIGLLSYTLCLPSAHRRAVAVRWFAALTAWAMVQSLLAYFGVYENSQLPVYVFIALPADLAALVYTLWISRERLSGLPLAYLLLINALRLPLWLLLGMASGVELIPDWTYFPVYQFDWLVGLAALGLYLWLGERNTPSQWQRRLAWVIAVFGLFSFGSAVGVLAATLSPQLGWFSSPAYLLVSFPGVLLPAVLGPTLLFSHFLMLRKLWLGVFEADEIEENTLQ